MQHLKSRNRVKPKLKVLVFQKSTLIKSNMVAEKRNKFSQVVVCLSV